MAQVWPRQDTFAAGGTHFGSRLSQWIGCRPTTEYSYGILADYDGDGHPYAHGLGGSTDKSCGFLWRQYQPEDVTVETQIYLRENAPADIPSSPFFYTSGPIARASGGTLTVDATAGIHYADLQCYAFTLEPNETGAVVWTLSRFKSGVRLILASLIYPYFQIPTDFEQPVGMKLKVTTVGGDAVLVGTISNVVYQGVTVSNLTLLTATDSSSDKITGTGRCGFLIGQDRVFTVTPGFDVNLREKITSWTCYDPADDSVLVRDEFKRTIPGAGYLQASQFGTNGRSVQSAFLHDINSVSATGGKILRDTSPADQVTFEASGLGDPNRVIWACVSQRPADDLRNQNPKITGRFKSSGSDGSSTIRQLGVLARASYPTPSATAATFTGYAGYIDKRGSEWTAVVKRYIGGVSIDIASADLGTLSEDTDYTWEMAVRDQPGTGIGGPVEIEIELGGVGVTLVAADAPGIFNSGSGIVVDGTAERITEGPGEGIWASYNDTTKVVAVTTWDQGTITPSFTPWEDLASYEPDDEGTASGNLATYCRVVFPFAPKLIFNTETTLSDAQYRYTVARLSRGFTSYERLATEPLTGAQMLALRTFWHSKEGGLPFTWSDPMDGIPRKVRFVPGSFEVDQPFRGVFIAYFGLEELAS